MPNSNQIQTSNQLTGKGDAVGDGLGTRKPLDDVTRNAIDWNPQGSRLIGRLSTKT